MLFITNLTWNSFTSQNSETHALFRHCLLRYILIYNLEVPYLFTYKAHSVIRRTLNFRRRLWQVSKIKISPKYPVIRRTQNYRKIFSNYAKHSSSFLWSKLQVEDRSRSRSREQQPWNCSRIRNIPGECRFLYTKKAWMDDEGLLFFLYRFRSI